MIAPNSPLDWLGPTDLVRVIRLYGQALEVHRHRINRLNVYPVPDGDTGTNMALTISSVIEALDTLQPAGAGASTTGASTAGASTAGAGTAGASMAETCGAIGHGALMGARGNSGLILSQMLRGLGERLSPHVRAGAAELAEGLTEAARTAIRAVSRPVEGTILTVARVAAQAAAQAASEGASLAAMLLRSHASAEEALARTPEQLEALARAGVVDAGGAGLVLLLDAFLAVVAGRPIPEPLPAAEGPVAEHPGAAAPEELRYEVMYLLDAPEELIGAFRECWETMGDSIVVVGAGTMWNCHIHTNDIGAAVEAGIDVGRPRNIRVSDLAEQVEEERWVRQAVQESPGASAPAGGRGEKAVACAVVAVANGEGVSRIFRSLGVSQIVAGGQSMNPSTAELLAAIDATGAGQVIVLPNNDNIVGVARQAAALSPRSVAVLPTEGVGEGFAALMEYDPQSSLEANAEAMAAAAARALTGEVTRSVRSSDTAVGQVAEGDWLGLSAGRIEVVGASVAEAACSLLAKLCTDCHELVTIIEGEEGRPADTRRITEWLAEHRPRVTAEVHRGGQPMYPYLLSVE